MADKLPWWPCYARDFVSDGKVEAMTTTEVGAYFLLLNKAWHERPCGSIPNDDAILARWSRLNAVDWAASKPAVLGCFTLAADNRWHQKRMQLEYRKQTEAKTRRKKAGKAGAEARWQTHGKRIATAQRQQCQSETETETEAKKKTPLPPKGGEELSGIPGPLDTPVFNDAWSKWLLHRIQKRAKVTPVSAQRQLAKLAAMGHDRALAAVLHSTEKGWTGIFEERAHGGQGPSTGGPVGASARVRSGADQYANVGTTIQLGEAPPASGAAAAHPAAGPAHPGGDRSPAPPGDPADDGW